MLEEDGWLPLGPIRFSTGKETRYPFCRRLRGPSALLDGKTRPHRGWKSRTTQPVASRYTNYDTLVAILVVQWEVIQMFASSV